jgi:hypothetical protein
MQYLTNNLFRQDTHPIFGTLFVILFLTKKQNDMRLFRHIATTALITIGAFSAVTYTSCTKSSDPANVKYAGTYKGNGVDNTGGTYTNWKLVFAPTSGSSTGMSLNVLDGNGASQLSLNVTIGSGTSFTVNPSSSLTESYTGTGTADGTTASLSLTETPLGGGSPTVYTFSSMVKQ